MNPLALMMLFTVRAGAIEPPASSVVLPLERYETLMSRKEPLSLTVVESARVDGSFAKGAFLTLSGRGLGEMPPVKVLEGDGVRLAACTGDALLARSGSAGILLTPLKPRFVVRCALGKATGDRFELSLANVLSVEGALGDGEVEVGDPHNGLQSLVATRGQRPVETEPAAEKLPPTAVGRYRVSVLPDDGRFRWELSVHNPNREKVVFVVPVRATEHVEEVASSAHHEMAPEGLRFEVAPGDVELAVSGSMKGTAFEPPVDAAAQFVLVESHPLLRVEVATAARHVGVSEAGIASQYRGAQAFLLARGQKMSWTTTQLEALPSTSYTLRSISSTFFVGAAGQTLGETNVEMANEGAAEISLPLRAAPAYAAVQGTPMVLTRDRRGDLWLPLTPGDQAITVQHKQALTTIPGFALGRLELPGLGSTATRGSVELRYGRDWIPLFESYAGERRLALPGFGDALVLLLLGLWASQLLTSWLTRRQSLLIAALLAAIAGATHTGYWVVLFGLSGTTMLWLVPRLRRLRLPLFSPSSLAGTATVVGLGMLLLVGGVTLFGDNIRRMFAMSADALAGDSSVSDRWPSQAPRTSGGPVAVSGAYTGAPARLELPQGSRRTHLSQELVDTTGPGACAVLLVSTSVVDAGLVGLDLALLTLVVLLRAPLLAGARRQLELLTVREPAPAL